jgi:hypothetical protein
MPEFEVEDKVRAGRKLPHGLSVRDYAAHRRARGLSGSLALVNIALAKEKITRICTAHPEGCPRTCRRGWIDAEIADRQWQEWIDTAKLQAGEPAGPGAEREKYHQARARREELIVEKLETEIELEAGRLVPAPDVRKAEFLLVRKLRDDLLRLPQAVAQELCAIDDPIEHERRHRIRIAEVLSAFAAAIKVPSEAEPQEVTLG